MEDAVKIAKAQTEYMWSLGRKMAKEFEWDNIRFTEVLIAASGTRKLLVWIYCLLRNYKKVIALEDLAQEDKEHMWLFIKDVVGERKNETELCKQMCMAFYALEYFLNEKR